MFHGFMTVLDCIRHMHEGRLVAVAGMVCATGTYAAFAIAQHATRATGSLKMRWGLVSIVASGCTAWATHFIVLLGFRPGMPAAFAPIQTAISLTAAIIGIGLGIALSLRSRRRRWRQFCAGMVIGATIAVLHYVGQSAYLVPGEVHWDITLVAFSVVASILIAGGALLAVSARNRRLRGLAAPLLLLSIAVLHFCGMAAMTLHFDPTMSLPDDAVTPEAITPVVAGVSLALLILAVTGWRFDLSSKARVRLDRERMRELANLALEGLLICHDDLVVTANNSMERLSGRRSGGLAGSFVSTLLPGLDIASMPEREEREAQLVAADGQMVPVRVLRRNIGMDRTVQTVIAVRDQRERLRTEAKMRTLAFNDTLTDLPNRTRFLELLGVHAASRRENERSFAVLMLDLDRFKPVNDTFGHAAGDIVLRLVADRLQALLRDEDIVARIGGDEFAILQLTADHPDAVVGLSQRIIAAFENAPFMLEGQAIHIGISIGIAMAPTDGAGPAELLHNADLALYAAKADGKGTFRRYEPLLDEKARERRTLEAGLRHALVSEQLELHYQPLVDAKTGAFCSAEALLRWHHPKLGMIPPMVFVSVAEETGLILQLGEWVLRTACMEAATWPDELGVAVNLSPAQFQDRSLVTLVEQVLETSNLAPHRLELEITEGILLDDEKRTLETLSALRAMGVRIAMDDFGTGYSSLSYLRKFPFDKLKIDQSFVRQIPDDPDGVAIVRAILTMSACLGIGTTVEGVETAEQFAFSVAEGCDTIQGYYVSHPLKRTDFATFIANSQTSGTECV
ncbi:bifunctional diguanylate cyclase/phosphodiesterase [Sphingomonas lacusdianchii]|uniref:bifunctional diguanylate cyclase/phosphodiesterase n=1 Tax=Sphingomonas lacusdianchii TaxID=2917992 RepID=UPI00241280A4|nr:EAL domain-containing protein [Sphingomonas sp. JXJ CY 53]